MSRSHRVKLVFILSVSMNLAAAGAVGVHWLWGECTGQDEHQRPGHEEVALDLSPDQEARFRALRSAFHDFRRTSYERVAQLREALLTELLADAPNQARIEVLLRQMSIQQAQLQRRMVQHLLAEKAVLRPQQRRAFDGVLRRHVLGRGTEVHSSADSEGSLNPNRERR